jgi:hypothetical protein
LGRWDDLNFVTYAVLLKLSYFWLSGWAVEHSLVVVHYHNALVIRGAQRVEGFALFARVPFNQASQLSS